MTEKIIKKRRIMSFEADEDVALIVELAVSTGTTLKEIVNDAIRIHGPAIAERKIQEREKQVAEFRARISSLKIPTVSGKERQVNEVRDSLATTALRSVTKKPKQP